MALVLALPHKALPLSFQFLFQKVVISLDLQLLSQITILQTVFKQSIITCFNFSSVPAGTLIIAIVLVSRQGILKTEMPLVVISIFNVCETSYTIFYSLFSHEPQQIPTGYHRKFCADYYKR